MLYSFLNAKTPRHKPFKGFLPEQSALEGLEW